MCVGFSVGVCQFVFISLVKPMSHSVNKPRWPPKKKKREEKKLNMLPQSELRLDESKPPKTHRIPPVLMLSRRCLHYQQLTPSNNTAVIKHAGVLAPVAAGSWTFQAEVRWGRRLPAGPGCRCSLAWWPCWTGNCCRSPPLSGTAAGSRAGEVSCCFTQSYLNIGDKSYQSPRNLLLLQFSNSELRRFITIFLHYCRSRFLVFKQQVLCLYLDHF